MISLHHGSMLDVLKTLPENSVDSCCTDPPYHLTSVVKRFGGSNAAPAQFGTDGAFARASVGFMQKSWDGGDIAFRPETWAEVYRVLKPGAFVAAFGASRGYHRMACAIEDAGFEIRDSLCWLYGVGFPKSHDVSKGIDKMDAIEARLVRRYQFTEWFISVCPLNGRQMDEICSTNTMGRHWTDCRPNGKQPDVPTREYFEMLRPHITCAVPAWVEAMVDERTVESENFKKREVLALVDGTRLAVAPGQGEDRSDKQLAVTAAHTPAAREWEGFGTALKPAFEPIVLARKPLSEGTVAANVLRWRTGALNIDACRIPGWKPQVTQGVNSNATSFNVAKTAQISGDSNEGRWPANVVHDGSPEVVAAFPQQKPSKPGSGGNFGGNEIYGDFTAGDDNKPKIRGHSDAGGSAARFFYSAKASKADRAGSKHPTVKPISLMEWLATLITPPGGTVLDPFAGSGTTGAAARNKGFNCILVEREDEYVADIRRRLDLPGADPLDAAIARYLRQKRALAGLAA